MIEYNDLPLFKWSEEEKQKRLEEEKRENEVEEDRLHKYGPGKPEEGNKAEAEKKPETQAEMIVRHVKERAEAKSIPPEAQKTIAELRKKAEEDRKKREGK